MFFSARKLYFITSTTVSHYKLSEPMLNWMVCLSVRQLTMMSIERSVHIRSLRSRDLCTSDRYDLKIKTGLPNANMVVYF